MLGWSLLGRDEVRLACRDFGGDGPSALLLHGLAGHAGEWNETARWLTDRCHVVAFDARGHGESELAPVDVTRAAHVADAVFVIEALDLAPAVLIGQSLGGLTAILVAAERPDLVAGLIIADASPVGSDDPDGFALQVGQSLASWPVPFSSRRAALEYFGGPSLRAEAWADGLERRGEGWWPRFDVDVMVRTLRDAVSRSFWSEWERIQCPTLVVRAGAGVIPRADAQAMSARLPQSRLIELPDAGHDLHLERAAPWQEAVCDFLESIGIRA